MIYPSRSVDWIPWPKILVLNAPNYSTNCHILFILVCHKQVRVLLNKVHAVSKLWNDAPIVLCGDFNCTPKVPIYYSFYTLGFGWSYFRCIFCFVLFCFVLSSSWLGFCFNYNMRITVSFWLQSPLYNFISEQKVNLCFYLLLYSMISTLSVTMLNLCGYIAVGFVKSG